MPLDITILFSQWFILLFVALALFAVILFLSMKQKKLSKELSVKRGEINEFQTKIEGLRNLQNRQKEFMERLEYLSREYVSKKFGLGINTKFSEMRDFFQARKNLPAIEYFEVLEEALFSGEPLDISSIKTLLMKFEFFVKSSGNIREAKILEEEGKMLIQNNDDGNKSVKEGLNEADPRVRNYLLEGKKRGFSFNILKQKLLHSGYSESEVNYEIEKILEEKDNSISGKSRDLRGVETILVEKSLNPKKIETVPYVKEKIDRKSLNYPAREPESYKKIRSFDDLERIESKITLGRTLP